MPLVNSITPKIINVLGGRRSAFSLFLTAFCIPVFAQDNSPYSRYGLGDLVPNTNVNSRAMGGVSAGYVDYFSINYSNPAAFANFQARRQVSSKKLESGRAIFDAGVQIDSRTLREPNSVGRFNASNMLFSHIMVGVPLRPNWGLSFGLRPVSRISYKISRFARLTDPNTGLPIDSSHTLNEGDGGTYLVSAGTGYKIRFSDRHFLNLGISGGYMFGKKDYSNRLSILNDSISYNAGNFQTKTTFGNIHVDLGLQYTAILKRTDKQEIALTLGAFGNTQQKLNASQDVIRETYVYDETTGYVRLDSAYEQRDIKGKIIYPKNITAGFVLEKNSTDRSKPSWLIGVDVVQQQWADYRFYGEKDPTLRNKKELRVGGQIRPVFKNNYFSNVTYRAGFFVGTDYIQVDKKLPLFGVTAGFDLPVRKFSRQAMYQETKVNISLEYIRRGNNDNLLKENMFRISAGFALSDLWFIKRKFD